MPLYNIYLKVDEIVSKYEYFSKKFFSTIGCAFMIYYNERAKHHQMERTIFL